MLPTGPCIIVFCNALEISNIKVIVPSADTITITILRGFMLETGVYKTLNSNPLIMGETSAQVIEYRLY